MGRKASQETTPAPGCQGLEGGGAGLVYSLSRVLERMAFSSPRIGRVAFGKYTHSKNYAHTYLSPVSPEVASGSVLLAGHLHVCGARWRAGKPERRVGPERPPKSLGFIVYFNVDGTQSGFPSQRCIVNIIQPTQVSVYPYIQWNTISP